MRWGMLMGGVQLGGGVLDILAYGEMRVKSMGEDFCTNAHQPVLENFD